MAAAIRIENVSKCYHLTHAAPSILKYRTLREDLMQALSSPLRWFRPDTRRHEVFWSLRDISLEVQRGEVIGVIGRNGAGKSTLLKILSRITPPTSGRVRLRGRVGSLLEVGTGFHGELNGRENIFLAGAILGMKRREIQKQFDAIVAFADLERFLDTPVKRYSSGMYVRLAFAVAAHLRTEILLVDEVLAVGDASFQQKCLQRMGELSAEGRTVFLVSHQLANIENLTSRVVVLEQGKLAFSGPTPDALRYYLDMFAHLEQRADLANAERSGNGAVRITSFHVEDSGAKPIQEMISGGDVGLVLSYEVREPAACRDVAVELTLFDHFGQPINHFSSEHDLGLLASLTYGGQIVFAVRAFNLYRGRYYVGARILCGGIVADNPRSYVGALRVLPTEAQRQIQPALTASTRNGPFLVNGSWNTRSATERR